MQNVNRMHSLLEMLINEPEDVFLNYALGIEYMTISDFKQAEIQFKKVLNLNIDYISVYYQLGKLLEAQLRTSEALEFYNIGLEKAKLVKNNKAVNEFNEAIFMLSE